MKVLIITGKLASQIVNRRYNKPGSEKNNAQIVAPIFNF